ncbi:MAG: 30S ribosome-binding factor RbfA [Oligoflexia bacterium]|nr:30S ribosome-binding factor RbfA [Oligoflexia bacterium]
MQETRRARLQAVIQEELSVVVPRELKDPRIPNVTFTSVEVAHDGSHANIYVTMLGASLANASELPPEAEKAFRQKMRDCLEGLNSASPFLRRHLARVLTVRHVPTLAFKEDRGYENTIRVNELLKKIKDESPGTSG